MNIRISGLEQLLTDETVRGMLPPGPVYAYMDCSILSPDLMPEIEQSRDGDRKPFLDKYGPDFYMAGTEPNFHGGAKSGGRVIKLEDREITALYAQYPNGTVAQLWPTDILA